MSFEQSVGNFLARADVLLGMVEGLNAAANARVQAIADMFSQSTPPVRSFFVHPTAGDDAIGSTGASDQPLRTVTAALARTPLGCVCMVFLQAPLHLLVDIVVGGKTLFLTSASSVRHNVTFERTVDQTAVPNRRRLSGFIPAHDGRITVQGLTIVMPQLDTGFTGLTETFESAAFRSYATQDRITAVQFFGCNLDLPATRFGPVIGHNQQPLCLNVLSVVLTGAGLTGRLLLGQTNTTTPVPTSSLPWLLTNLTEV